MNEYNRGNMKDKNNLLKKKKKKRKIKEYI